MPWRFLVLSGAALVALWLVATPVLARLGWTGPEGQVAVIVVNAVWLVVTSALYVLRYGRWR